MGSKDRWWLPSLFLHDRAVAVKWLWWNRGSCLYMTLQYEVLNRTLTVFWMSICSFSLCLLVRGTKVKRIKMLVLQVQELLNIHHCHNTV